MQRNDISSVRPNTPADESSYLYGLPAVRHLAQAKELAFSNAVTCFVGGNGTGKSTLLEAIAVAYGFNAEGGTRNFSFPPAPPTRPSYNLPGRTGV